MRRRLLRRRHDGRIIADGIQSRDILGNRAVEQGDPLRQITDIAAQDVRIILVQCRAIDADLAARRLPRANDRSRKCRLSRARRADDPQCLTGFQLEVDHPQHGLALTRRHDGQVLRLDHGARTRQRGHFRIGRNLGQQFDQPHAALLRAGDQGPLADGLFHRGQRAAHQDRTGDHRARGQFVLQHQIGAHPQHRRLQEQPERARGGGEAARQIRRMDALRQRHSPCHLPAVKGGLGHAKRLHCLCLLLDSVRHHLGLQGRGICAGQRDFGGLLVCPGQHNQDHPARN